ncbi:MAG: sporulation sigma factor SigK [Negativibacillus sp.]
MLSPVLLLALSNMLFFALHITTIGSFPRPLSREEELECLKRMKEGDPEAKSKLIEHNLRLVAHIIKKG